MSSTITPVEFDAPPAFGPIYKKILFGKKPKGFKAGNAIPPISAHCAALKTDVENLRAYEAVLGLPQSSRLPLLYPHVLTGSLHLAIMTQPEFPLSMMGAVHLRNHVLEHRPLDASEEFDTLCTLDAHRIVKQGVELDVTTVLTDRNGERAWESVSTYLVRGKFGGEPQEPPARATIDEAVPEEEVASWYVPAGTGRRYAKVCGDYNPIHIHPLTAKLFGFKRDIVHGMWAAGVCLARLGDAQPGAVRCDILFKGPTFMKSKVVLKKSEVGTGERFDQFCGSNPRPVISGWRRTPGAGELYL
jgi:hypothetical protein